MVEGLLPLSLPIPDIGGVAHLLDSLLSLEPDNLKVLVLFDSLLSEEPDNFNVEDSCEVRRIKKLLIIFNKSKIRHTKMRTCC